MAWNSRENKSLSQPQQKSVLGYGAPVASNPSYADKPYRDSWDIERAYREGMQKITWVNRCIDAIAGNQARLPIILRKENSRHGEIVVGKEAKRSTLLELLNTKANIGENAFIFRYRLSAQLLLGTRGAFIEKIRGKDGGIIGLNLLPPQSTAPIPCPRRFVSGYEVQMPYGQKVIMKPEDVVWIRRPHPLDPYLSLTPLEASGVAIEIENLAKLYNRNYLLNDGRPGGLMTKKNCAIDSGAIWAKLDTLLSSPQMRVSILLTHRQTQEMLRIFKCDKLRKKKFLLRSVFPNPL
jgi:phage portal protein BeeE